MIKIIEINKENAELLLEELHSYTLMEYEGIELTEGETERYVNIVKFCQSNNINIPFGIEL